eukprot:11502-Heterococcus_DN1.PRE.1
MCRAIGSPSPRTIAPTMFMRVSTTKHMHAHLCSPAGSPAPQDCEPSVSSALLAPTVTYHTCLS